MGKRIKQIAKGAVVDPLLVEKIKNLRALLGLSQAEFAEK